MAKKEVITVEKNLEIVSLKKRAIALLTKWQNPIVKTAEQFEEAGVAVKDFAYLRKELKALTKPKIDEAKAAYDAAKKLPKEVDDILEQGEASIRTALVRYDELHRKAQEVKIEKALEKGNDEKAAAIAAKPYIPEVQGLSFRELWSGEVVDFGVFLSAILDGRIPQEAVEVNASWLNAQARAKKSEDLGIPGARGVKTTTSAMRS